MITPAKMSEYEQNKIIEMYSKLNRDITAEIIKTIENSKDLSSYTKSQLRQIIKQNGNDIFYMALEKSNKLSNSRKKEMIKLFKDIQKETIKGYNELNISSSMIKLTKNMINKTNKTLKNLTKTIAFSSKKAYTEAVDDLYLKVATGSKDYNSAMKQTITNLAEKGITLKSKGRNYKLESTVKMNLMTSLTQTANDLSKEVGKEIEANCVVIGHTPYCRPTHRVIDGVIMSIDKFKKYEDLTQEPNCYHIVNYDWRPEFENAKNKTLNYGHLTNAEYNKNYNIREKQNYYAKQVRNKKEQVSILKKGKATEELTKAKKELRNAQTKYRQFSNSQNIDVDYSLTWKYGYNR